MLKKIKNFLTNISGVAIIEFAIVITVLLMFTAASVDVYTAYNIKTRAQDVVHNIAFGVSKTDLNTLTLEDADNRVITMMQPYDIAEEDFRFDIHTIERQSGTTPFTADITGGSGTLTVPALDICTAADLNIPTTLENGFSDIITARLCVNPEQIQPSIFGALLDGVFDKDQVICHRVCTLGQNTIKNHDDIQTVSRDMNSFGTETLNLSYDPSGSSDVYETTLACRMVITDIEKYGPCSSTDSDCNNSAFYHNDVGFPTRSTTPPTAGECTDDGGTAQSSIVVVPTTPTATNITVEVANNCNHSTDENNIDTTYFDGPDDTRATAGGGTITLNRYETVTDASGVSTCVPSGTETWTPKGSCGEWTIVDSTRSDLTTDGVFYTQDACPHPRTLTTPYGLQDGCTRVLVPRIGSTSDQCDMSNDFVWYYDDGVYGMEDWNRMRREIYHLEGYRHEYGGEFFYDNFNGEAHGGSDPDVIEGVSTNQTGGRTGPRPPDGPRPDGGTNSILGTETDNRYEGNPLY